MTAVDVVRRADQLMRGKSSITEMTMTIVKPEWSREVGIKSWAKGEKQALIMITAPARDKGTTFLLRDKEVWNWVPSIERVVKIPPSMMMQSWMGSDFTNDDLVKESSIIKDYTHSFAGDSTIDGRACWKLELIPIEDAAVVWGKVWVWIDKVDFLQLYVEYFDEDAILINRMIMSDIKKMGGRLLPCKMEMIPADKQGHKTVMVYTAAQFDIPIQDSFFSEQNMKKVR